MKIALLGDMAFYGKYCINHEGVTDYFKDIADLLKNYDYVVGNLESPFVDGSKSSGSKSAYLKSNPRNIELLKYLQINVVNLANNHIFDYGEVGYLSTLNLLINNEIQFFGIENKQLILTDKDVRVALHGYCCYSTNPLGITSGGKFGVNRFHIPTVEKNLELNNNLGYYNILSVHGGQEHVNYPSLDTIRWARQFARIVPYVYYGHHPHVIQGIENHLGSLICYSLGNFCFDDVFSSVSKSPLLIQTENNKSSFILELELKNNVLIRNKIIPIYAGQKSMIIGSPEILDKLKEYSEALDQNPAVYASMRNSKIQTFLASRRQLRDFSWVIKRLRPRYAVMVVMAFLNRFRYKRCVEAYLDPSV